MSFNTRRRLQEVFGRIILLVLCAGLGYTLARLSSAYMPKIEQRLANLGPVSILVLVTLIGIWAVAAWIIRKLADAFCVDGERPLAILCAALFGLPATIVIAVGLGNGLYGAWSGACYFLVFAASCVIIYAAITTQK